MVDEVVAPVETAPIAPAVEAPAAAPVVETAPVVTPEAPVVTEVVAEPVKTETVLGAEPPKAAEPVVEKPAEEKKVEIKPVTEGEKPLEEKKAEGDQSVEPAPLPAYEEFKLPEGITITDTERLSDFTKTLAEFETVTKADHAEVQKFGQQLVDKHIAAVQKGVERMQELNIQAWEKQKSDWKESFINDPEIGGNRQETTVSAAREFITTHGGTPEQQTEFRKLMESSGVGNHPAMIRMLANAMKAKAEGSPLPATKPMPESSSKVTKRYGSSV
jgi:hypothetical protein